ncbi:MAG: thioredoxin [Deltaproteobacteria bacterium]|nr:thioredoxin [Deltaproteobacteria bacterium]MBW2209664.1 thioredoxin [Deltaproteobacteria bacterium]MBW2213062.1 thioredoxin [Deltaproteobacteria bacterium]MBW2378557.1 thioredoxin [Deltaproteobacteria bacterium]MBW2549980.1 thioredoxin [Deltaproteobacteria bacterium]
MAVQSVTDATFEAEVLRSELPVLVDLYADWCQPCKQVSPIVEQVAQELVGKIKVVKVDVDSNPMVAQTFRAQSIPMLLVIAEGRVAQQHVGALDRPGILRLLEPVMPRAAAEVSPEELALWLTQGKALPVDIRDAASYARYRIPSAIHVPTGELASRVEELQPFDGRIRVLYGRSEEAKEWSEKLQADGVQVGFLAGGFLHWEADGLEVERG